jgi:hypothetical protein
MAGKDRIGYNGIFGNGEVGYDRTVYEAGITSDNQKTGQYRMVFSARFCASTTDKTACHLVLFGRLGVEPLS